jgi:Ca2+-binding RTX toxin-like protein
VKRVTVFMVVIALLVGTFAGVAVAVEVIICGTSSDRDPDAVGCRGTNDEDQIMEREGNGLDDTIRAEGRDDIVTAAEFKNDEDRVFGEGGNDRIRTDDGDNQDFINCGKGNKDIAIADKGDNVSKKTCEDVRLK